MIKYVLEDSLSKKVIRLDKLRIGIIDSDCSSSSQFDSKYKLLDKLQEIVDNLFVDNLR